MSGIRPFKRQIVLFHTRPRPWHARAAAWYARAYPRRKAVAPIRERARREFHKRHGTIAAPAKLSRWKRFLNWLAELYVNLFVGGGS